MESYESVLLVKPEVYIFNIPPRTTNRGYRAADWNLNEPTWTGRLRLVTKEGKCSIKLEDKNKCELFAECPIDTYPGIAIEPVTDSSRYFVLRIQDGNGRSAFIGLGFGDRSDSFDLNVALQDHFKWVKKEQQLENEPKGPELDLSFKEGETIKINMKITKKDGSESTSKTRNSNKTGTGILAPPPGSNKIAPPPGSVGRITPQASPSHSAAPTPSASGANSQSNNWSDFMTGNTTSSAAGSGDASKVTPASAASTTNWVQF